jgi:BirA family transcriptional regulator, biotin operon repressor / biotin---[acetyl-CoA-carboxylase] ligase
VSVDLDAWLEAVREGVAAAAPRAGHFAQHVRVLSVTGSTNDDVAHAAAEGAPEGHTVIAAEQRSGRGRRGARWHSPAAHGLYLSTLLRPDRWPVARTPDASLASSLVTLMAGVAVATAIREAAGVRVELKWPNDVVARVVDPGASGQATAAPEGPRWRKLAGILAEGASEAGLLRSVVLGVGLNLRRSPAPPEVSARMIALEDLTSPATGGLRIGALVAALLVHLRDGVVRLSQGGVAEVREQWRQLAPSVDGTRVRWHHQGGMLDGRANGIDACGALRVLTSERREVIVHGGEIEWLLNRQDA